MTVEVTNPVAGPYYPNGVTTSFPFSFKIMAPDEIAIVDADGVPISASGYAVTLSADEGGAVVFSTAPTATGLPLFYIVSAPSYRQSTKYGATTTFNPGSLNGPVDRLAVQNVSLHEHDNRTIFAPVGDTGLALPSKVKRAGSLKVVGSDVAGNLTLLDGQDFKGSPGAGVGKIGLRSAVPTMILPEGADAFRTSGAVAINDLGDADYAALSVGAPVQEGEIADATAKRFGLSLAQRLTAQMFPGGTIMDGIGKALTFAKRVFVPRETLVTGIMDRQVLDGEHLVIDLDDYAKVQHPGAGGDNAFRFWAEPKWVENITALAMVYNIDTSNTGIDSTVGKNFGVWKLTLTNARDVKKGDILKIISDDGVPDMQTSANYPSQAFREGEFVVSGTDNGNTNVVYLTGHFAADAPTIGTADAPTHPYLTNPRLAAVADASVTIRGGTFDMTAAHLAAPGSENGWYVELVGLRNSRIALNRINHSPSRAIRLYGCCGVTVEGYDGANMRNDGKNKNYGYGIDINNSSHIYVSGLNITDARHTFTTNPINVAAGVTDYQVAYHGSGRNNLITDCRALSTSNASFDTHSGINGMLMANLVSHNSYMGANSNGAAVNLRGRNVTSRNIQADNCVNGININTTQAGLVTGAKIRGVRGYAIQFDTDDLSVLPISGYEGEVRDCEIDVINREYTFPLISIDNGTSGTPAGGTAKNKATIRRSVIRVFGWSKSAVTWNLFSLTGGFDLLLDDVILDLRGYTGLAPLNLFRVPDTPGSTLRGTLRVMAGANKLQLVYPGSNVDFYNTLKLDYVGDNDLPGVSDDKFFGVDRAVYTHTAMTGSKTVAGVTTYLNPVPANKLIERAGALTVAAWMNGTRQRITSGTAKVVTVNAGLDPNFVLDVIQGGAGQVSFAAGAGVTIVGYPGLKIAGQGGKAKLEAVAQDSYILSGALAA